VSEQENFPTPSPPPNRLSARAAFAAGKLACVVGEARSEARDRWPAAWKAAHAKRLRGWLA
jgi:hypothetical protein